MKRFCLSIAALALVAGAASASTMPDAQAQIVANEWYATQACVSSGFMTPATASVTQNYISEVLAKFSDTTAVNVYFNSLTDQRPALSRADCDRVAAAIQGVQAQQNAQAEAPARTYMPTFTTCNRVFGQVSCMTY